MSQNDTQKFLTAQQLQAVELLAAGLPVQQVAEQLGVCRKTLYRWHGIPEYKQELQLALAGMRESMHLRLLHLVDLALEELEEHFIQSTDGKLCARIALTLLRRLEVDRLTHTGIP